MDQNKLNQAVANLKDYLSVVDDVLYANYSVDGLKEKLAEIQSSIDYLESLRYKIVSLD